MLVRPVRGGCARTTSHNHNLKYYLTTLLYYCVHTTCPRKSNSKQHPDNNINNMYCQQAQLGWPNFAPGFNQNKVGQGYCAKRTMADPSQVPVLCTRKFVDQMRSQNLLGCDCPTSALHRAHELCNNVQTAYCGTDGQIIMSLM